MEQGEPAIADLTAEGTRNLADKQMEAKEKQERRRGILPGSLEVPQVRKVDHKPADSQVADTGN